MAAGRVKTGGRQKGTINKVTRELREVIKDLLNNEFEKIDSLLEAMDPKDRLSFVVKLLPYTLPRYESMPSEDKYEDKSESWGELVDKAIREVAEARKMV